jgi:hypothetical protein
LIVAIGDLNDDGEADVVSGNQSGTVSVLLKRGDGSLEAKRDYSTSDTTAISTATAITGMSGTGKSTQRSRSTSSSTS